MVSLQQKEVNPLQNFYNSATYSKQVISFPQQDILTNATFHYKELAAKKHSEAERRRRLRINGQYATLRTLLPNLVKVDKASVLEETIKSVRELQKTVKELKAGGGDRRKNEFPNEVNELNLSYSNEDGGLVKATLSCEDKPGLMSDIARAVRSVKARVLKVEMATVGGRIKCELLIQGFKGNESMVMLKKALKLIIDKPASLPGNGNKLCFYK
ncbi:transcription factor bHLH131 isoform X2 [Mangifera indica]|uniref:transcription factor bHLH131 isoform X2 n=1 Tax=Mangifera indica TaxID=29780 RepID=UPI001CFBD218|nr:transcription factor bHLH131 isoform X2 [Mangifera indica]